jgi:hypothetical protein
VRVMGGLGAVFGQGVAALSEESYYWPACGASLHEPFNLVP